MNTGNLLTLLAGILYLVCLILVFNRLRTRLKQYQGDFQTRESQPQTGNTRYYLALWFIALLTHIIALHYPLISGQAMTLDYITVGSYVMWLISVILFFTTFKRNIEVLAIIVIPITLIALLTPIIIDPQPSPLINMKSGLGIHILFSLLAYSMLMLASFQALLLAVQNKQLHRRKSSAIMNTLPSLEDMEHLLFRFITIGVILLSIGLLSGFYFLDNLFGANIAHKTILSIFAWIVFSVLLYGRWQYGWRGKKAVNWTLAGFVLLMLAFFGTKVIQEFISSS